LSDHRHSAGSFGSDPPLAIVADKAYDSRATRQAVTDEGALAVIPTRRTTRNPIPYDTKLYAQRKIA
jgi:hypothetical protein